MRLLGMFGCIAITALCCQVAVAGPFADNLDAHWTFDSDFTDSSGNNHNASGNSGANVASNITAASKIGAGALTLDGSGENLRANTPAGYKGVTGTASRTLSAWIRADSPNDNQSILSWGNNSGGQKWTFRLQDGNGPVDGSLRVEVNGGFQVGTTDLDDGNWHHVVATFENDGSPNVQDVLLYVDGELEAISASQSRAINTASGINVRIGSDHANRVWEGEIDDAGIFTDALDAEFVRATYELGNELGYDLGDDVALFDLFNDADPDASVTIDDLMWQYVDSGLTGGLGLVDPDGNGGFSLQLNSAGAGLQTFVIPEPGSIAIWTLLALTGFGFYRWRK